MKPTSKEIDVKTHTDLLNKIRIIVGEVYNKGASDLLASKMSIKCEMDRSYEIMDLFEQTLISIAKGDVYKEER